MADITVTTTSGATRVVIDTLGAAASAQAAATSASAAATSASNAATSASGASTSATNASNSASAAATSETNAAGSASAAATSASAAATSASNAATSASGASTSATNASNSASAASTSETNAAGSASAASASASAAATSASNAATAMANLGDGSAAAPVVSFAADTDSGFYRIGANNIGAAVNGAKVLDISTAGFAVTGVLSSSKTLTVPAGNIAAQGGIKFGAQASIYADSSGTVVRVRDSSDSGYASLLTGSLTVNGGASVTGSLNLASVGSGQIIFPATQNASSNANTLDDYEEGTFTPTVAFGGAAVGLTYGTQVGSYTKIGNRVYGELRIELTAKGSSTGSVTIGGLPFTSAATNRAGGGALEFQSNLASGIVVLVSVGPGTSAINLYTGGVTTSAALTDASFTDTSALYLTFSYRV